MAASQSLVSWSTADLESL
jgi:hypothetical protein